MGRRPNPGARASRPHNTWHSLGHLLDPGRPARAPCLCFGRAHAVPAGRAAGCPIARKPSGNPRDSMRAGRPRSRGCRPDGAVEDIRGATSLKADRRPLGNSRLPAGLAPSPYPGADQTRVKQQIFLAYREQGPCQVNSEFRIIEHGCTGCTGLTEREAAAREADSLNDRVRICGCPGLQASGLQKKSCASCASM